MTDTDISSDPDISNDPDISSEGATTGDAAIDLGELTLTRVYDAPRELVFRCMITPEHLTHFWGPTGIVSHQTNVPAIYRSEQAQAGMQSSFDRFATYVTSVAGTT